MKQAGILLAVVSCAACAAAVGSATGTDLLVLQSRARHALRVHKRTGAEGDGKPAFVA